jgi:hypothetical protein
MALVLHREASGEWKGEAGDVESGAEAVSARALGCAGFIERNVS